MNRLTLEEYSLLVEAEGLKQVDMDFRIHLQAYLNKVASAEKKSGKKTKMYFDSFNKFFDYEKALKEAGKPQKKDAKMKRIEEFMKKGGNTNGGKL